MLADPVLQQAGLPQVAHGGRSVPASDSAQGGESGGDLVPMAEVRSLKRFRSRGGGWAVNIF